MADKKTKQFISQIAVIIEKHLKSQFGLNIESSEIKHIKQNVKVMKPYQEIVYMFRYDMFIKCPYNLRDHKMLFINTIRKKLSEESIAETKVGWAGDEKLGEYFHLRLDMQISVIEEIQKSLNKFKFISQKD